MIIITIMIVNRYNENNGAAVGDAQRALPRPAGPATPKLYIIRNIYNIMLDI